MTEKGKLLENIYKVGKYEFDTTDKKQGSKEKRPVVWADAEEVVEKFLEERNLIGNYTVKVMADGWQGFFKICLSIIPEDYESFDNDDTNFESEKKEELKLTSVHHTIHPVSFSQSFYKFSRIFLSCPYSVPSFKYLFTNLQDYHN